MLKIIFLRLNMDKTKDKLDGLSTMFTHSGRLSSHYSVNNNYDDELEILNINFDYRPNFDFLKLRTKIKWSDNVSKYEEDKNRDPEPSYALDTLDADIFRHLLSNAKTEEIANEMIKLGYDKKLVKKHLPRLSKKWEDMLKEKWCSYVCVCVY